MRERGTVGEDKKIRGEYLIHIKYHYCARAPVLIKGFLTSVCTTTAHGKDPYLKADNVACAEPHGHFELGHSLI